MKYDVNMIGGGFQHDVCSSALNKNKYINWVKNNHTADVSIHIDDGLRMPVNDDKINYGWINESSAIIPHIIEDVLNNLPYFKSKFKNIFCHNPRVISKDPELFKFTLPIAMPWIQNKKIYKKSKLVSFIGSNKKMCSGHHFRLEMIEKYKDVVDHYGRGFAGRELPWVVNTSRGVETGKILGLKDYMFSFAMENEDEEYAFCEKTTDCFATGTIPIYWGGKKITEFFDERGIIFLDDLESIDMLTEELYLSKAKYIKKNFHLLENLNTSEDFIYLNYLKKDNT